MLVERKKARFGVACGMMWDGFYGPRCKGVLALLRVAIWSRFQSDELIHNTCLQSGIAAFALAGLGRLTLVIMFNRLAAQWD
ncbi:hypothetical protein CK489_13615 [Bradyrhizobium sp. UFLA03-84]|nr:hypothetical protein CK489_13615 [Bradyrhizobium sp. UFLA03-84]